MSATRCGSGSGGLKREVFKRLVGRRTDFTNNSSNIVCTQGVQKVAYLYSLQQSELAALKTTLNGGVSTALPMKIFFGYQKLKLQLRNQSNVMARVCIYDLVPKRQAITSTADNPVEAWQKGLVDFGLTNGETVVGQTPLRSPEFRRFFHVVRASGFWMEAGEQHEHTFYRKINKLFDSTAWDVSSPVFYPGLSAFFLIVVYGALAHDNTSATSVTTAPVTLDYAYSQEITSSMLPGSLPAYAQTNSLPTAIANLDQMGESGDADNDPTAA